MNFQGFKIEFKFKQNFVQNIEKFDKVNLALLAGCYSSFFTSISFDSQKGIFMHKNMRRPKIKPNEFYSNYLDDFYLNSFHFGLLQFLRSLA